MKGSTGLSEFGFFAYNPSVMRIIRRGFTGSC